MKHPLLLATGFWIPYLAIFLMHFSINSRFEVKDFIETEEGLIFAVVASWLEQGRVLCFLRYADTGAGWVKMSTDLANQLLVESHPDYFYYSGLLDAHLHAVPVANITKHHQARHCLRKILSKGPGHAVEADLFHLLGLLRQKGLDLSQMGITGSVLVGLQNDSSDIDLVCFNRTAFHQCRFFIQDFILSGGLQPLSESDWQDSYQRRSCALNFNEYVWHEQRKFNKALVNGRKFDLSLVEPGTQRQGPEQYQKLGPIVLQCRILDDTNAFAYPAEWVIDHPQVKSVVSFTATYTGQVLKMELAEVSGTLEKSGQGLRIVVGSSREAPGEYIKVIHAAIN